MPSVKFQPQFVPLVESGQKTQTIRPVRKRPIKVGDRLLLDAWKGQPYRSTVRRLGVGIVESVRPIEIGVGRFGDEIEVAGQRLDTHERAALSRADGFGCATELLDWFQKTHGLPFAGVVIRWRLLPNERA